MLNCIIYNNQSIPVEPNFPYVRALYHLVVLLTNDQLVLAPSFLPTASVDIAIQRVGSRSCWMNPNRLLAESSLRECRLLILSFQYLVFCSTYISYTLLSQGNSRLHITMYIQFLYRLLMFSPVFLKITIFLFVPLRKIYYICI